MLIPHAWGEQSAISATRLDALAATIGTYLKSQIRTSVRPLTTFHYFKTPTEIGITSEQIAEGTNRDILLRHSLGRVAYTWETIEKNDGTREVLRGNGERSKVLRGLFVALEPVSSAEYGGENPNWAMLEIQLPAGFRYLELGAQQSAEGASIKEFLLPPELKLALGESNCPVVNFSTLLLVPSTWECTRIWNAVVRDLNVDAILYPFPTYFGRACPLMPNSALFFVGEQALRGSVLRSFNAESDRNPESRTAYKRVMGLFAIADATSESKERLIRSRRWPDHTPLSPALASLWSKQNLFSCDEAATEQPKNLIPAEAQ